MAVETAPSGVFGASIKRREDPRLISGNGTFLDDVKLPGMTHAAILRSPYAHAAIKSVNLEAARAAPGVLGVFAGADLSHINPLPLAMPAGGVENNGHTPRALAIDKVRFQGEPVAVVVAERLDLANDALRLIEVEYEPLPTVVDAEKALEDDSPKLHDGIMGNRVYHWEAGDRDAADQAIAGADVVVRHRIHNQRLIPNAMEARGSIGLYTPGEDSYTLWATSQAPHVHRILVAAFVLGIPEHKLRVITPQDLGGGFGSKIFTYYDMPLVLFLAKKLGRPVKFVETRRENYLATTHGRDLIHYVEAAAKRDGTITGLKVRCVANLGAYCSTIAPGVVATLYGRMVSGPYRFPAIHSEIDAVYTNTMMVDAYRGAGRPEATYMLERTMDLVAGELGLDPAEVRRKNFIQPEQFPYTPPSLGMVPYDSGNYAGTLDKALQVANYQQLRRDQEEARKQGRLMGIGLASYVEICGVAPSKWIQGQGWGGPLGESAQVRVFATGKVQVTTGSLNHGQGHETTMAQIVAHEFGIPFDDIDVLHGDTNGQAFGLGTYGSRSAAVGGTAMQMSARKVKDKMVRIGAHMLEASVEDVEYRDGKVQVKGAPDRGKAFGEISMGAWLASGLPEGEEGGLEAVSFYDPPDCTFPFGTHLAVVEIDPATGLVELKRYLAVDDVGEVINPMIVDGQLHGGIAQGLGQALYEGAVYDENGSLLSGSMMDYVVPKADQVPNYELDRTVTPSPVNPMGVKGAGEAGTIVSTPTVANAVFDALAPLGIKDLDMPLSSQRVWRAIQSAGQGR
jgi:aerobic carbon-monoxide dehydrogenase large subunit